MKTLAEAMEVTPGSATAMVKHLDEEGLIHYYPRKGTSLTDEGRRLALSMIRRHRLLETFLVRILGYDWSEVHLEAEELEHAVSESFMERVDTLLGSPTVDPHGDPIPSVDGTVSASEYVPLSEAPHGGRLTVARIISEDREFLTLMQERGIVPGAQFILTDKNEVAGTISLQNVESGEVFALGYDLGQKILVK